MPHEIATTLRCCRATAPPDRATRGSPRSSPMSPTRRLPPGFLPEGPPPATQEIARVGRRPAAATTRPTSARDRHEQGVAAPAAAPSGRRAAATGPPRRGEQCEPAGRTATSELLGVDAERRTRVVADELEVAVAQDAAVGRAEVRRLGVLAQHVAVGDAVVEADVPVVGQVAEADVGGVPEGMAVCWCRPTSSRPSSCGRARRGRRPSRTC